MMRLILLFILILFFRIINVKAQVFDPQTEWYYCSIYFPPYPESCFIEKLQNTRWEKDTLKAEYFGGSLSQYGRQVWFEGYKWFDFDLKVGDTLFWSEYSEMVIDSLKTIDIFDKNRRVQFGHMSSSWFPIVLVEGIGALEFYFNAESFHKYSYFIDPNLAYTFVIDPKPVLKYIFVDQNLHGPIGDLECESCEKLVSNIEQTFSTPNYDIQISNDLMIISGLKGPNTFQLFNVAGQLLQSIKSDQAYVEVNLSNQNAGVYFLRILTLENGKVSTLRFVKGD